MPRRYYSSNAVSSTLSSGINSTDTSITIPLTTGWPSSHPFTIIIDEGVAAKEEVCNVTATATGGSTITFTITRAQDGTTGVSHSAGATVKHGVSARDFDEPNAHVNASSGVHSVSGSVVGTTDTQTLTNKTLTSPTISSPMVTGALNLGAGASIVFEGTTDNAFETTLTVDDPLTSDRTLTLPNATDTLVARNTFDTLINKTINASNNTITNVSLATAVTGTLPVANGGTNRTSFSNRAVVATSAAGAPTAGVTGTAQQVLKFDGSNDPVAGPVFVHNASAVSTQIMAGDVSITASGTPGAGTATVTFPYTFTAAPTVVATTTGAGSADFNANVSSISTTSATIGIKRIDGAASTATIVVDWVAIAPTT